MNSVSRRSFLKKAALVSAAGSVVLQGCGAARRATATASRRSQVIGANGDVRLAVIGFRGRGADHIREFGELPGVRIVALCDADRDVLNAGVRRSEGRNAKVEVYTDVRKLLENPNIDAVSVATPNHWHSLMTVWACQAGKDVYVEKPVSHNVWEGRKAVEAARKYGRIVQAGTQNRSDAGLREAIAWLKEGNLGRILLARGLCYKRRKSIGKVAGPTPIPSPVDYDLWTGPAELLPLMRKELHYDWHWVWNTGSGDIGNQGIHEMDIARWATGATALAPRVMSVGGRFGYDDDGETANTQFVFYDYPGVPILFEVQGLPMKPGVDEVAHYKGIRTGNVIHCEHGYYAGGWAYDQDGKKIRDFPLDGGAGHMRNFIDAVRSRKRESLNADILEGHLSSALCHVGNVSHRLGTRRPPEEIRERLEANSAMLEAFERFQEHLAVNGVDLSKDQAVHGPWLEMDPKAEKFTGSDALVANALISRNYRAPFVVPEKV